LTLRPRLAAALPGFIANFLAPDLPALRVSLTSCYGRRMTEDILCESYPEGQTRRDAALASRRTIRLFERVGILESAAARERFEMLGLMAGRAADNRA